MKLNMLLIKYKYEDFKEIKKRYQHEFSFLWWNRPFGLMKLYANPVSIWGLLGKKRVALAICICLFCESGLWAFDITIESKISMGELLKYNPLTKMKYYVHNIFTINYRW